MCPPSAPKPPKIPKVKQINPFEGAASDPRTKRAADALGLKIDSEEDMRRISEYILREDFNTERNSDSFREAEKALYKEGTLTGLSDNPFDTTNGSLSKKHQQYANKYNDKNKGAGKNDWKYSYTQDNFRYEDQQDLQRIYDKQNEIEMEAYNAEQAKTIKETEKRYIKQQRKQTKKANQRVNRQNKKARIAGREAEERQAELMREMMDQPVYQPRQAALPKIQAKAKTPKPMPVAPAPPPTMSISTAPAPELVNVGNPMNIVKQSSTSRSRSRGRNKGTSSLT